MRRALVLLLLVAASMAALAVEDGQVLYVGGTVSGIKPGAVGRFDAGGATSLVFEESNGRSEIPYANIERFEYSRKLAHDLGVLPTIAVVLVKQFQHRHFLTIRYRDSGAIPQIAVFELSKQMPQTILPVLQARASQGCPGPSYLPVERRCSLHY